MWLLHVRVSDLAEEAASAETDTSRGRLGQDPIG